MAAIPIDIKLLQKEKTLTLRYEFGAEFVIPCAVLRAYSPSADNRQMDREKLLVDKCEVNIVSIEPVGQYALKFIFDDGHQTGIYDWAFLFELAEKFDTTS